ncbi:hypothetical protein [Limosilactobacillus portuensis]|uniref:hypothetical protein n=1 Tax=Limosilactobacillus portuensis TaxID=2742601 RepID=UPI003D7064B8
MKVTKLVVGILLLVLAAWLLIDGIVDGILGIWTSPDYVYASLEIILSGLFIGAGVVYIVQENSPFLGGDITGLILLVIGGIIGIIGGFIDRWMFFYAVVSLIVGVGFFIWHSKTCEDI